MRCTYSLVAQLHHHVDVVAVLEPVEKVENVYVRVAALGHGLVDLNLSVQLLRRAPTGDVSRLWR